MHNKFRNTNISHSHTHFLLTSVLWSTNTRSFLQDDFSARVLVLKWNAGALRGIFVFLQTHPKTPSYQDYVYLIRLQSTYWCTRKWHFSLDNHISFYKSVTVLGENILCYSCCERCVSNLTIILSVHFFFFLRGELVSKELSSGKTRLQWMLLFRIFRFGKRVLV